MSPKLNIIILIIVGILALAGIGYGYKYYTDGIDLAIQGMVANTMGLPHQQGLIRLESENVRLFYPEPPFNFKAGEPVEVIGEVRVFEGQVEAELVYADGAVIAKQSAITKAKEAGEFGSFSLTFNLPDKQTINNRKISLKVYSLSAKDGSRVNEVFFPITIVD